MSDKKVRTLTTMEEIKAISDPYRYRILKCFSDIKNPATVKQVADTLGEVPAKVYYHVKKLEKVGILRLSHTEEINGIIAKYYELVADSFDIKSTKEVEEPIKKLMLSESQKIIAEVFDNAKAEFLNQIDKYSNVTTKGEGDVRAASIYCSDDELLEFNNYINKFIDKHQKAGEDKEIKKYNVFFNLYRTVD
ncbi:ArsR/SmtB family transcription factor [Haloimpatiens massiliensis]|uniref:ArsR/SmtB family transcription factor n=1 Tax=Haloimpatiens massiliensis TaxID=1658110 RepID=UPI000C85995E|nr:helix-turn-helix domain-containing protein [Haloimpatiens massiliensis]